MRVQPWLGWPDRKRRGVALASHDWILSLDADEIATEPLGRSIRAALAAAPDPHDGLVVERREEFPGRLVPDMRRRSGRETFARLLDRRHSGQDPDRIVPEEMMCPGRLHRLEGDLLHWRDHGGGPGGTRAATPTGGNSSGWRGRSASCRCRPLGGAGGGYLPQHGPPREGPHPALPSSAGRDRATAIDRDALAIAPGPTERPFFLKLSRLVGGSGWRSSWTPSPSSACLLSWRASGAATSG